MRSGRLPPGWDQIDLTSLSTVPGLNPSMADTLTWALDVLAHYGCGRWEASPFPGFEDLAPQERSWAAHIECLRRSVGDRYDDSVVERVLAELRA